MPRPALTRIAGTIAATLVCAAAATEAAAQDPGDGTVVLNEQFQSGDLFSGQTLNVVDASDQVTVSNAARGNSFSGATVGTNAHVTSNQNMAGDTAASTVMTLGGDTEGVVNATTQARANYLAAAGYQGNIRTDATQLATGGEVVADSLITDDTARLQGGAYVGTVAVSNTVAVGGEGTTARGIITQGSSATVRSSNFAGTQYVPAEARFTSQAIANAVEAGSEAASNQSFYVRQRSTGDIVEAGVSANAGNAWDLASRANAAGNQAVFANQGGALIVETDQGNSALVRAAAVATSYDYGRIESYARAAGNEMSAGNNDVYVEIDNTQFNSGGVESTATFSGHNGYDAYVGADAVGNAVTGYACASCEGRMNATNNQTNDGAVSAVTNTTVGGSGRAVITGANAVGNSATFYVTRPGDGGG